MALDPKTTSSGAISADGPTQSAFDRLLAGLAKEYASLRERNTSLCAELDALRTPDGPPAASNSVVSKAPSFPSITSNSRLVSEGSVVSKDAWAPPAEAPRLPLTLAPHLADPVVRPPIAARSETATTLGSNDGPGSQSPPRRPNRALTTPAPKGRISLLELPNRPHVTSPPPGFERILERPMSPVKPVSCPLRAPTPTGNPEPLTEELHVAVKTPRVTIDQNDAVDFEGVVPLARAETPESEDDGRQSTRQEDEQFNAHHEAPISPKKRTSVSSLNFEDDSIGELHRVWHEKSRPTQVAVFGRGSVAASVTASLSAGQSHFSIDSEVQGSVAIAVPKNYRKTATDIIWEDSRRMQNFERFMLNITMRPNSVRRFFWDIAGMALIIFDLVTIPLGAFEMPDTLFSETMGWLSSIFWTLDIPCSFITGYHADGVIELRPRLIAKRYARSWLPFDVSVVSVDMLISIIAASTQMAMNEDDDATLRLGRALRFLRLFRLLRLLKMQGFIDDLSERIKSEYVLILLGILKLLAFIMVMNHLVACAWYGIGNWDKHRRDTWVQENGLPQKSLAYSYFTSLHWSITQFTPASMEVVPENEGERAFTVLVIIFAMVAFSSFISTITGAMTQLRNLNNEKLTELSKLRSFLMQNRVDADLTTRIWRCLKMSMAKDAKRIHLSDVSMVTLLPWKVKSDLRDQVFHPILSQHPFFFRLRSLHGAEQDRINQTALKEIFRGPGQEVFLAGEAAEQMYFVASGVLDYSQEAAPPIKPTSEEVKSGQWASEAVLWIRWRHTGQLATRSRVGLVTVLAEACQSALRNLPEPGRYARKFARFCQENPEEVSDIWSDYDELEDFVEEAFAGPVGKPAFQRKTTQMAAWSDAFQRKISPA